MVAGCGALGAMLQGVFVHQVGCRWSCSSNAGEFSWAPVAGVSYAGMAGQWSQAEWGAACPSSQGASWCIKGRAFQVWTKGTNTRLDAIANGRVDPYVSKGLEG